MDASFSPDGSQIVLSSLRSGRAQVYVMQRDGTNVRQLTDSEGGNVDPSFSPDGRIAFTSFRDRNAEIYVMAADGSDERRLTNDPEGDSESVFSPDGSTIAFQSFRAEVDPPAPEIYAHRPRRLPGRARQHRHARRRPRTHLRGHPPRRRDTATSTLRRLRITTNDYSQAPLQGPPLVGVGVDDNDFLLATADDPRQAPRCGPDGRLISPLPIPDEPEE